LEPVKPSIVDVPAKSIGNSSTAPHDIENHMDAECLIYILAESVGYRIRSSGFYTGCVTIRARDTNLVVTSHQRKLKVPTNLTDEIARAAVSLFEERYGKNYPYRSIGLSCTALESDTMPQQLDLFQNHARRERRLRADLAMDALYNRWPGSVRRGVTIQDRDFARIIPARHDIHSVPVYNG